MRFYYFRRHSTCMLASLAASVVLAIIAIVVVSLDIRSDIRQPLVFLTEYYAAVAFFFAVWQIHIRLDHDKYINCTKPGRRQWTLYPGIDYYVYPRIPTASLMSMEAREIIVMAANVRGLNSPIYAVAVPGRHHHVAQFLNYIGCGKEQGETQGFLTSRNRFVDREEGWKIAEAAGQITREVSSPGTLWSENMW